MQRHPKILFRVAIALGALVLTRALQGQPVPAGNRPLGGESYGPGTNFLVIPAAAFTAENSNQGFNVTGNGYIQASGVGQLGLRAGIDLPAGASVVTVCGFTYDNSALSNASVLWGVREMGGADADPNDLQLGINSTGPVETAGYDLTCANPASPITIRKFQDLNGDGFSHYTWYYIRAGVGDSNVSFGGAVVTWVRTVSPDPGGSTFGDVSTDFLYHRAIEALAASGITGGCGSGNYCPNQSVTRGEMAAFLARALGLHWPY